MVIQWPSQYCKIQGCESLRQYVGMCIPHLREYFPEAYQIRKSQQQKSHKRAMQNTEYRKKFSIRVNMDNVTRYRRYRTQIIQHYSRDTNTCNCCGESHMEFLTIDHINGRNNSPNGARGIVLMRWLIENNFPEGYQILCANCNLAKGDKDKCPVSHGYGMVTHN